MRELITSIVFTLVVFIPFTILVGTGFHGKQNSCITDGGASDLHHQKNTCYCECFGPSTSKSACYETSKIGKPGVRQALNTWSNLYVFLTVPLVLVWIWLTRRGTLGTGGFISSHPANNYFTQASTVFPAGIYPLVYAVILIFLGLGSMWFHASLTQWGGWFDNFSMYPYTTFLIIYTTLRLLTLSPNRLAESLLIGFYCGATFLLCVLAINGASSLIISVVSSVVYALLEFSLWFATGWERFKQRLPGILIFWLPAVTSMLLATLIWKKSQTGGPWCSPAGFQGHAAWHWLSGLTAMLLYFYWRYAPDI